MKKKTKVIAFRLNPRHEMEKDALEIIEQQKENGVAPREFLTDVILRFKDVKPEMYKKNPVRPSVNSADDYASEHLNNLKKEILEIKNEVSWIKERMNGLENTIVDILRDFLNHLGEYDLGQYKEQQPTIEQPGPNEYERKIMDAIKQRQQQGRR